MTASTVDGSRAARQILGCMSMIPSAMFMSALRFLRGCWGTPHRCAAIAQELVVTIGNCLLAGFVQEGEGRKGLCNQRYENYAARPIPGVVLSRGDYECLI